MGKGFGESWEAYMTRDRPRHSVVAELGKENQASQLWLRVVIERGKE